MMEKKLQYKFSPEYFLGDGVHFAHEWTHDQLDYRSKEKTLKEMVAWCYENWNGDPKIGTTNGNTRQHPMSSILTIPKTVPGILLSLIIAFILAPMMKHGLLCLS